MRLTDDELERLRTLEARATPGEWEAQEPAMCPDFPRAKIKPLKIEGRLYGFAMIKNADATFIAEIRNAAPALLAEVKAARLLAQWVPIALANLPSYSHTQCCEGGCPFCHLEFLLREYEKDGGGE